jgi:hypothetical protein
MKVQSIYTVRIFYKIYTYAFPIGYETSVNELTAVLAERKENGVRSPWRFLFSQNRQENFGDPTASYTVETAAFYLETKAAGTWSW